MASCSEPEIFWCVNALRGHLFEYGYIFPQGITHVATLVALVEDVRSSLPKNVRIILKPLIDTFTALEEQIAVLDAEINQRSKTDPTARRLMTEAGESACPAGCRSAGYFVRCAFFPEWAEEAGSTFSAPCRVPGWRSPPPRSGPG